MFACAAASSSSARASARWVARWASSCTWESDRSSASLPVRSSASAASDCFSAARIWAISAVSVVALFLRSFHFLGRPVEVSLTLGQTLLQHLDPVMGRLELGARALQIHGTRLRFRSRGFEVGAGSCHAGARLLGTFGGRRNPGGELLLRLRELRGMALLRLFHLRLELFPDRTDLLFELRLALDELGTM